MLIEHRYKWQQSCKSYSNVNSIQEIIDWLVRFENKTLEDYFQYDDIEEIRITLEDKDYVRWIQLHRKSLLNWSEWDIVFIVNDYPLGSINSWKDLLLFLRIWCNK